MGIFNSPHKVYIYLNQSSMSANNIHANINLYITGLQILLRNLIKKEYNFHYRMDYLQII